MFRRLFRKYQHALVRRPYFVQMVQTGVITAGGDALCQTVVDRRSLSEYHINRTIRFFTVGFFFTGPVLRFWYGLLWRQVGSKGFPSAVARVAFDQLCFSPFYTGAFLFIVWTLGGRDWKAIEERLKEQYVDIMLSSYCIWPWAQLFNFYFVPLSYQVLVVQIVALCWNIYLSWKMHLDKLEHEERKREKLLKKILELQEQQLGEKKPSRK